MNYINEPYFAVKAWTLMADRDLLEVDEKADFLDYTATQFLLTALCVAETVELVARALFSFIIVPYYFVAGKSYETYRNSIIYTALTIGATTKALYHNVFSKFVVVNVVGSAAGQAYERVKDKIFEIYADHKDLAKYYLNIVTKHTLWQAELPQQPITKETE